MKKNHWISLVITEAKSAMQIRGEMSTLKLIPNIILREGSELQEKIALRQKSRLLIHRLILLKRKGKD